MSEIGLRERKRQRMYRAVSEVAVRLFLERGFDAVSVAEVAAAAEISKPTLFRYFPAKEDLVLHRIADHEGEAARVVAAGRAAGVAPLPALRRHFLDGLAAADPVTGLNDHPAVRAFYDLLYARPPWSPACTATWNARRRPWPKPSPKSSTTAVAVTAVASVAASAPGWRPGRSSPSGGSSPRRTGGGSRRASRWRTYGRTRWRRRNGPSRCWARACRSSRERHRYSVLGSSNQSRYSVKDVTRLRF